MISSKYNEQIEQNYQISLERTADYHLRLTRLRRCFRALLSHKNYLQPIHEAYNTMNRFHISTRKSECFEEWHQLTLEKQTDRNNEQLAIQFHCSVIAARALESWKVFTKYKQEEKRKEVLVTFYFKYINF